MSQESITDQQLMQRLASGSLDAADELVERYQGALFGFIFRLTVNNTDAEDIFQEVWMRVVRYRESFNVEKKFSTWLFQIALNATRDFYRKSSDTVCVDDYDFPDEDAGQDSLENKELAQYLLKNLSLPFREVIVLRYFEMMKEKEIASVLDIPLGTVKSRIHKAIGYLQKHYSGADNARTTMDK